MLGRLAPDRVLSGLLKGREEAGDGGDGGGEELPLLPVWLYQLGQGRALPASRQDRGLKGRKRATHEVPAARHTLKGRVPSALDLRS
eukprot:7504723-Pyramimonas_sp.AAC.1